MPDQSAAFRNRLIALGVPGEVAPGLAPGGPMRAFFTVDSDEAILRYFAGAEARPPGPYFDPQHYKGLHPDWAKAGSALGHYLLATLHGRDADGHPLFDADDYARFNPDVAAHGVANLLHFALHGDAEGRRPSAGFDPAFYRNAYLPHEITRPFAHFITKGRTARLHPVAPPRAPGALARQIGAHCASATRPVLLIGHDARRAGAPMMLLAQARALAGRGWHPIMAMLQGGPLMSEFSALGPALNLAEGWAQDELAQLPADLPVIANTVLAAPCLRFLMQKTPDRPALLMIHEMPDYWDQIGVKDTLIAVHQKGARLVFSGAAMRAGFAAPDDSRLHVLRPGLPPQSISCSRRRKLLRQGRGAPGKSGPVIIGAGHADRRKGFDRFLDVARSFTAQQPQARFIWLGAIDNWAQALVDKARKDGVSLALPGFAQDSAGWYAAADLFLLTSRQDPGPTVAFEAMLQGTPLVGFASDLGLKAELQLGGVLVPDGDITTCVNAMTNMLSRHDQQARRKLRQIIHTESDFDLYIKQLEALLTR